MPSAIVKYVRPPQFNILVGIFKYLTARLMAYAVFIAFAVPTTRKRKISSCAFLLRSDVYFDTPFGDFAEYGLYVGFEILSDARIEIAVNAFRGAERDVDVEAGHPTSRSSRRCRAWSRRCRCPRCTCPFQNLAKRQNTGRFQLLRPDNPLRGTPSRSSARRRR